VKVRVIFILAVIAVTGLGLLRWEAHRRHVREGTASVSEAADILAQETPVQTTDQATVGWCAFLDGRHSAEEWDAHYAAPVEDPESYDVSLVELAQARQDALDELDQETGTVAEFNEATDAVSNYCDSR
jgi:hypothetical protein